MVTTQDVSFGVLWTRLIGAHARWAPGDEDAPALTASVETPLFGMGLVAVWIVDEGPVLVCHPVKGLRVLRTVAAGTPVEEVRRLLRESGAVLREDSEPPRDSVVS